MARIINVRGTSGSGKSHLVRNIFYCYDSWEPRFVATRKRPLYYVCGRADGPPLCVIGHYETDCGGADTISKELEVDDRKWNSGIELVFHLVNQAAGRGEDVIFEGLIISSDVVRTCELKRNHTLLVIGLSTPLPTCFASIQTRRDARGDDRPLNRTNTELKFRSLFQQRTRLRDSNVDYRSLDRAHALEACVDFLGIRTQHEARLLPSSQAAS